MRLRIMVLAVFMAGCLAAAPMGALTIQSPGAAITLSADALRAQLPAASLRVYNPAYGRELSYRGFWLEDVLRLAHFPSPSAKLALSIRCKDGYVTIMASTAVGHHQWLLAYEETSGHWTPLRHQGADVSPGPWYLVGKDKASFEKIPWPYQVTTIAPVEHS